jgi:hypothetical protein
VWLTFVLWLLYRRLAPEAEPAVVLASDPATEHIDLLKEIAIDDDERRRQTQGAGAGWSLRSGP